MGDHRCGEQVQPESDIAAPRPARRIAHVPAHREAEHRQPDDENDGQHDITDTIGIGPDRRHHQRNNGTSQCCGACGNSDRHHEALPVDPGRCGGDQAGQRNEQHADGFLSGVGVDADDLRRKSGQRQEHTADKGEQKDDRGQGHPPLAGEEFGKQPSGARNQRTG